MSKRDYEIEQRKKQQKKRRKAQRAVRKERVAEKHMALMKQQDIQS